MVAVMTCADAGVSCAIAEIDGQTEAMAQTKNILFSFNIIKPPSE
jgi:hypothetical protein